MKKVSDLLQESKGESWFDNNVVNNIPVIMAFFANFIVIVADYRAYDVVYQLSGSWWKALSASLACAVPFVLWEIGWQYNSTTDGWRRVSLGMAGLAFVTSIFLGVADYLGFSGAWADVLLGGVVILTGLHTVVFLLDFYNDPDVAMRRHQKQAQASMVNQEINTKLAEQLLASGSNLLATINELEKKYDPEDVEAVLNIIQGKKKSKPSEHRSQQRPAYAQNTSSMPVPATQTAQIQTEWLTLAQFLAQIGLSEPEARLLAKGCSNSDEAFKKLVTDRNKGDSTNISRKNFRKLYYGELNHQPAAQGNGQNANPPGAAR